MLQLHTTTIEVATQRPRELVDITDPVRCAVRSGYSLWHFQRVFQALVGDTVGSYIRRRRLSASSHLLLQGDRRIVEIALEFQFQSHEAYSRAFRRQFSVSPQEYRRRGQDRAEGPEGRDGLQVAHLDQHIQPAIVLEREHRMAGLAGRFHRIRSDRYDGRTIGDLWQAFFAQRAAVPGLIDGVRLGVIPPRTAPGTEDDDEGPTWPARR